MLSFKKLKDQLIKDFIIVDGDLGKAAAFSEGMDISEAQYFKYVRQLETALDDMIQNRRNADIRARDLLKNANKLQDN